MHATFHTFLKLNKSVYRILYFCRVICVVSQSLSKPRNREIFRLLVILGYEFAISNQSVVHFCYHVFSISWFKLPLILRTYNYYSCSGIWMKVYIFSCCSLFSCLNWINIPPKYIHLSFFKTQAMTYCFASVLIPFHSF
jgi:hypothetical protein